MPDDKLEKLTGDLMEAVLSEYFAEHEYVDFERLPEDIRRELELFNRLVEDSDRLKGSIFGLVDFLDRVDCSPEQKVLLVARQYFLMGWKARGAVDDAAELEKLN